MIKFQAKVLLNNNWYLFFTQLAIDRAKNISKNSQHCHVSLINELVMIHSLFELCKLLVFLISIERSPIFLIRGISMPLFALPRGSGIDEVHVYETFMALVKNTPSTCYLAFFSLTITKS